MNTANALVADCSGAACPASGPGTYAGSGTGVWRYTNTSSLPVTIDISISGVSAGNKATLLFSNGTTNAVSSPAPGVLSAQAASLTAKATGLGHIASLQERNEQAHALVLERTRAIERKILKSAPPQNKTLSAHALATSATPPAVGSSRTWYEIMFNPDSPVAYSEQVVATCTLPSGRNLVVWLDPSASSAGIMTPTDISAVTNTYCGPNGGYARITSLLGDVWGSAAAPHTGEIQDNPNLQDVNIVFINKPGGVTWCGYHDAANTILNSVAPSQGIKVSNEALAFFIDANCTKEDQQYMLSSLLHETTHMINYYQHAVSRGYWHEDWLEESSAMMTEDIVVPAVLNGYSVVKSQRLALYMQSGAAFSYTNWGFDAASSYGIGGSFAAFLNRRYGLSIYKQLVTDCKDGVAGSTSYSCLDGLIVANGGTGFADEFAHFGATVFSAMPPNNAPFKYGYPAKTDSGYALAAIDLSTMSNLIPAPNTLSSSFTPTTQVYQVDIVGAGKSNYLRHGVIVPANTTLLLVIE